MVVIYVQHNAPQRLAQLVRHHNTIYGSVHRYVCATAQRCQQQQPQQPPTVTANNEPRSHAQIRRPCRAWCCLWNKTPIFPSFLIALTCTNTKLHTTVYVHTYNIHSILYIVPCYICLSTPELSFKIVRRHSHGTNTTKTEQILCSIKIDILEIRYENMPNKNSNIRISIHPDD